MICGRARAVRKRSIALLLLMLVSNVSCFRMRFSEKQTTAFFEKTGISFQSEKVILDGQPLYYVSTGSPGKPLLFFVHGSPGSWNVWRRYLTDAKLLERYHMVAVDRPGFGYSGFGQAEDLAGQAKILNQLANRLSPDQTVTFVGHSMGGPVIMAMAVDNPSRMRRLFLLAGAVAAEAETPECWRRALMAKPLRYAVPGAWRVSNDELWWLKDDLKPLDRALQNIKVPIVVIHGTKDPLVPFSNALYLEGQFPSAQIKIIAIAGANHFIPWQHYEQIRDALLQD